MTTNYYFIIPITQIGGDNARLIKSFIFTTLCTPQISRFKQGHITSRFHQQTFNWKVHSTLSIYEIAHPRQLTYKNMPPYLLMSK